MNLAHSHHPNTTIWTIKPCCLKTNFLLKNWSDPRVTSQGLWYCLDDAQPRHGYFRKRKTWNQTRHLRFGKSHVLFQKAPSNLSYSWTRGKIILQTFLRTGSNSCVWGGQSLAKIGKNESFSTGHPNNSGGRSAASICNKALAVSCKSFCMERLRSFSAWGWSWLDMNETSPWDGKYFRRSLDRISFFGVNKWSEVSNQMMFPKQIVCPRYILSCLGHLCTVQSF